MAEGIVPWVQGADPARYFAPVFGEAANAASRRAQLTQEMIRLQVQQAQHAAEMQAHKEQVAQEMELKKQVQQQNLLMDQQRLAIQQQYHQQQMAINQQKVDEQAKRTSLMAEQKARQYAAQQRMEQAYQSYRSKGLDEATSRARAIMDNPGMLGNNVTALSQLAKLARGPQDVPQTKVIDGETYVQKEDGGWQHVPKKKAELSPWAEAQMKVYQKQQEEFNKAADVEKNPKKKAELNLEAQKASQRMANISGAWGGGAQPTEAPAPSKDKVIKIQMKDGQLIRPPELMPKDADQPAAAPAAAPAPAPNAAGSPWMRPAPPGFGGPAPAPAQIPAALPQAMARPPAAGQPGLLSDLANTQLTAWAPGADPSNPQAHLGIRTPAEIESRNNLIAQQQMLAARKRGMGITDEEQAAEMMPMPGE